ncbi:MAG: hypothetical protein WAT39_00865 [Planctomycetota bacterium]
MNVLLCRAWQGLVLAGSALGQVSLGAELPKAAWQAFAQGEPVAIGTDAAPKCTVFAFYTRPDRASAMPSDGDYFAGLQQRFGERGLVVVAVVADAKGAPLERWPGCRVAVDEEQATTGRWLTDFEGGWHVVLADRAGKAAFLGSPDAGLVDAIDAVLAGREVGEPERQAFALRHELPDSFDDATADVVAPLAAAVAHAPRDGLAQGLLYLAQATKANDAKAAAAVLAAALERLAGEGRPLATFADLALRGDPRRPGLAAACKPVLQAAAKATPNEVPLQLAFLRALVLAGDEREVGRQSMKLRKAVTTTAEHCIEFAAILTAAANAPVHRDLATMALERAAALAAPPRLLTAARYGVATRCANDGEAGKKLLDEYLRDTDARVTINNDCWYLMTQLPTMGRCDPFAAALAERMLEQKEGMDYFEFDTAALAMFLVGRFAEAVSLQETAIEKGGKGNPEYTERLNRYKAGQAQPPR